MSDKEVNKASIATKVDNDTYVVTTAEIGEKEKEWLLQSMENFDPRNRVSSVYINNSDSADTLTQDLIVQYSQTAQTDVATTKKINAIIRGKINSDDLIGMVAQAVANNVNTDYRLSYNNFAGQRNKAGTLKKAKAIIDTFNKQIDIRQFIRDSIVTTYEEGNYITVLRDEDECWAIDNYPLGIAEISTYKVSGKPVVLVNIEELKSALQKTMLKTKKKTPLFFENMEKEIKENYPKEVYDAYKAGEKYAKLDVAHTGVVRVNNHNKRYGLSPIFRALSPLVTLADFQSSDSSNAKAKARKIIHQVLRKECLGPQGTNKALDIMTFSHQQFISAFANTTVVYTSPAAVEKIEYVEPKVEDVKADKIQLYRSMVLGSLGVSFLVDSGDIAANTVKVSLKQLLQHINSISEQVERVLENYYVTVLAANNVPPEYVPSVKIIDSEMMETNLKLEFAKALYGTFGASRQTAFEMLDIDLEDEKARREQENKDGLSDIFTPYPISYTTPGDSGDGDNKGGRPKDKDSNDPKKQEEDEGRNNE